MAVSDHNLIWVDMEMTGLIPKRIASLKSPRLLPTQT